MAAMADAFHEMRSNSTAADLSRVDWLGLLLACEATRTTTSASAGGWAMPDCAKTLCAPGLFRYLAVGMIRQSPGTEAPASW
jgi:hypothetical protein